jgi:hypothetical protein
MITTRPDLIATFLSVILKEKNIMIRVILLFGLLSLFYACELQNPETGVFTEEIITLTLADDEILADDLSRLDITAQLGLQADANQEIILQTEEGRFAGSTEDEGKTYRITPSSKTANATLISSNLSREEVILSAEVGGFIAQQKVDFIRAYPELMILQADKSVIDADRIDLANITVELFRTEGVPSTNAQIDFEVVELDSAQADIVEFTFSNNNLATATIRSGNGNPGKINLIARTKKEDGEDLEKMIELEFQ